MASANDSVDEKIEIAAESDSEGSEWQGSRIFALRLTL